MLFNGILPAMRESKLQLRDLKIEILILGGQAVTLEMLEYLEKREGIRVISWMESGEVCTIAYSNEERTSKGDFVGMIPANLFTFFEIVDENGKQLPIGKRGRLLATRLVTHAQPLIRYDLEDETAFMIHRGRILFDREFVKL